MLDEATDGVLGKVLSILGKRLARTTPEELPEAWDGGGLNTLAASCVIRMTLRMIVGLVPRLSRRNGRKEPPNRRWTKCGTTVATAAQTA